MNHSIHPPKPPAGSWTEAYDLGTGDIPLIDCSSPEVYEQEREAIFKKVWLNLGRVEELPRVGSYVTKELQVARTSILLTRGSDDKIRAFYNMCSHRGNQLVWDQVPSRETCGTTRQFQCKYHAWRYALDGSLTAIAREDEFFKLDKSKYGLTPVHCEIWEGWIFINLDQRPEQSLEAYLGEFGRRLKGYPFHKMSSVWTFKSSIKCNWKPSVDGVMEILHAPFLHTNMSPEMAEGMATADGLLFEVKDGHNHVSWRGIPPDLDQGSPMERLFRSGLFGPKNKPDVGELPPGINPTRDPNWGVDHYTFFPNWTLLIWEGNFYMTYRYWPVGVGEHIFEAKLYHAPARCASERLAQEAMVVTNKEYSMQDFNTYEATQRMLDSGVKTHFPISDQEVLIRHFHKIVHQHLDKHQAAAAAA